MRYLWYPYGSLGGFCRISITTETNLVQTDFLDVTFNLETEKFWPYWKPGDQPFYINMRSYHPSNIKKQQPQIVKLQLSRNSCDEEPFKSAAPRYEKALKDSKYFSTILNFVQDKPLANKKNSKRKTLWFNPPFNSAVITNIGEEFFGSYKNTFHLNTGYTRSATKTTSSWAIVVRQI